jgi:hypothetical protein
MRRSHVEMRSYAYAPLQYVGESHDHKNDVGVVRLRHAVRLVTRGFERNAMSKTLARAVMRGDLQWK